MLLLSYYVAIWETHDSCGTTPLHPVNQQVAPIVTETPPTAMAMPLEVHAEPPNSPTAEADLPSLAFAVAEPLSAAVAFAEPPEPAFALAELLPEASATVVLPLAATALAMLWPLADASALLLPVAVAFAALVSSCDAEHVEPTLAVQGTLAGASLLFGAATGGLVTSPRARTPGEAASS